MGTHGKYEITRATAQTGLWGVTLRDLDLSRASLRGLRIGKCTLINCRFDQANLSDLWVSSSRFESCSFVGAKLPGATLGTSDPVTYQRVSFVGADLSRATGGSATFVDCDFSDARMKGAEFWGTRFRHVRFRGKIENVTFAGRRTLVGLFGHEETLVDVDLSECDLRFVDFRDLDLGGVNLPNGPGHIVIRGNVRCVLDGLLAGLAKLENPGRYGRAVMAAKRQRLGPRPVQAVIALADHVDAGDQEALATLKSLVASAVGRCG